MDDNKVWAFSNTGTRSHAFVATAGLGRRRAMCSARVERAETSIFKTFDWAKVNLPCGKCQTLYLAMVARAEASMEPVNPYDQVCEGVVTSEGAARVADDKPLPPGMNRELLRQAKAVQEAHKRLFPVEVAQTNELNERTIDAAMPTRPDMNAVTEAPDSPAVLDALHKEALEEDDRRTAEAHGVVPGARFIPRRGTRHNPERVVTVMRLNHTPYGFGVTYSIWEPGHQGPPGDWGSTVNLRLFIRQYEPEATAERDEVAEAIRTLRKAPYAAVVQAMGVLERAGIFAEASDAPLRPTRWYYTAVVKAPGADSRRVSGFVNAAHPEAARQAVRDDWKDKLRSDEYLDYLQVEEA